MGKSKTGCKVHKNKSVNEVHNSEPNTQCTCDVGETGPALEGKGNTPVGPGLEGLGNTPVGPGLEGKGNTPVGPGK
jgi:hypothetical protein